MFVSFCKINAIQFLLVVAAAAVIVLFTILFHIWCEHVFFSMLIRSFKRQRVDVKSNRCENHETV